MKKTSLVYDSNPDMAFLVLGSTNTDSPPKSTTPKTPEEVRNEQIEDQLSPWDGSHRAVTKIIKAAMNDPNSFEHVQTR